MAGIDTGYLYGQLNNYVEYLTPEFNSTDGTIIINNIDNNDNKLNLSVNTTQLITLKQVIKDSSPSDDPIKYYSLYAFNQSTRCYDIKIGQEIVIDTSAGSVDNIKTAYVKVGEQQKYETRLDENGQPVLDSEGNEIKDPVYDNDGNPVMVPIYQEVIIDVSQSGQLILDRIPASAIVDEHEDGTQIQSTLDGNDGGEVY